MKNVAIVLFLMFGITACGAHVKTGAPNDILNDDYEESRVIQDPLESLNRAIFDFNDGFYENVLDPVSGVYADVVPQGARNAVGNLVYEANMPIRATSSLIQFDILGAISEFGATLMNLSWGIVAPLWGYEMFALVNLESDPEDLGQALDFLGFPSGPYIVWPFLGPSTLRDSLGTAGGVYINPASYVGDFGTQLTIKSSSAVNDWSLAPDRYSSIVDSVFDPYLTLRRTYYQNREEALKK